MVRPCPQLPRAVTFTLPTHFPLFASSHPATLFTGMLEVVTFVSGVILGLLT
jgi:hypothetical protein